jgi:carboxymethylenebutenolidase
VSYGLTDPLNASSPDISRRGFTALGIGAALVLSNAAAAGAQSNDFGKPHPPIVPEDDPAIDASRPRLMPSAGSAIGAYAATPRVVTRQTPGVVVVQHIWGVDTQIRDVVRRFAKAGFVTIAPQLYDRLNPPNGDGASDFTSFAPIAQQMKAQGLEKTDFAAARNWIHLQARDAKIGIVGFCMGGGIALQEVIGSDAYAAAAMFYGNPRPGTKSGDPTIGSTFDFTTRVTTPLLGSFGARDTSIARADVAAMFARLTAPHEFKIYDEAGHAFFDDTRDRYVASAASDAWARTLAWFTKYLVTQD